MHSDADKTPTSPFVRVRQSMDILIILGILFLWVILQVWVLPKAGIPT
jgi:hypothetical protein